MISVGDSVTIATPGHPLSGSVGKVVSLIDAFEDFRNHWTEAVVLFKESRLQVDVDVLILTEKR
jgi:hypothetical protein